MALLNFVAAVCASAADPARFAAAVRGRFCDVAAFAGSIFWSLLLMAVGHGQLLLLWRRLWLLLRLLLRLHRVRRVLQDLLRGWLLHASVDLPGMLGISAAVHVGCRHWHAPRHEGA